MRGPIDILVKAVWDADAEVWVATSEDVPGLVTEAESHEALIRKLSVMVPELLRANGVDLSKDGPEIPLCLLTERKERLTLNAA